MDGYLQTRWWPLTAASWKMECTMGFTELIDHFRAPDEVKIASLPAQVKKSR